MIVKVSVIVVEFLWLQVIVKKISAFACSGLLVLVVDFLPVLPSLILFWVLYSVSFPRIDTLLDRWNKISVLTGLYVVKIYDLLLFW